MQATPAMINAIQQTNTIQSVGPLLCGLTRKRGVKNAEHRISTTRRVVKIIGFRTMLKGEMKFMVYAGLGY
jgi:hypothetical protein